MLVYIYNVYLKILLSIIYLFCISTYKVNSKLTTLNSKHDFISLIIAMYSSICSLYIHTLSSASMLAVSEMSNCIDLKSPFMAAMCSGVRPSCKKTQKALWLVKKTE